MQEVAASIYHSEQDSKYRHSWLHSIIAVRGRHAVEGLMGLIDKYDAEEVPIEIGAIHIVSFYPSNPAN